MATVGRIEEFNSHNERISAYLERVELYCFMNFTYVLQDIQLNTTTFSNKCRIIVAAWLLCHINAWDVQ